MTERARVVEVNDGTATVVCFEDGGCESCNSMFCNPKARKFEASLSGKTVKSGDQVEIHVPPASAIGSGFLVLMFPLLLFVAAYLGFGFLESEPAQVGTGLGGLVLGFVLVWFFGKQRKADLPKIVKVFKPEESLPVRPEPVTP